MKGRYASGPGRTTEHLDGHRFCASLISLIARQVEESSLVVWNDPSADCRAVERIEIPDTRFARDDGSFLNLRREIDSLLNGLEPPNLVVHVRVEQANTCHALVELEEAGVVMQPCQQPAKCNTRLAFVARNALKSVIGDENAAEVERWGQKEMGQKDMGQKHEAETWGRRTRSARSTVSI
jgi:hypothetical protein